MKYIVGFVCCIVAFTAGVMFKTIVFYSSTEAYLVNEELVVDSKNGRGVIPKGTELYLHSNAHGTYTYHLYIDVPHKLSEQKIVKTKFDSYGGIKRIVGVPEEQLVKKCIRITSC